MKKLVSLVLSTAMVLSSATGIFAAEFRDISNSWAKSEINRWADYGVLNGYDGAFRPDDFITRAEMSVVINNVMGYEAKNTNTFTDVPNDIWYTDAMLKNNAAGTIVGSNGQARPDDNITREEAVAVISRALSIESAAGSTTFADDAAISDWARGNVKAFANQGLIAGRGDNQFVPKANITRAEVVKILDNTIKGFYYEPGEYSASSEGYIVVRSKDVVLKDMAIDGDIIIAAGIGSGQVVLENVDVNGTLIAEGGGADSIVLRGDTSVDSVETKKVTDYTVGIYVDENATIGNVDAGGNSKTVVSGPGKVATVNSNGAKGVDLKDGANVGTFNVNSAGPVVIGEGTNVTDLNITDTDADEANVTVNGTVENANVNRPNTVIKGSGTIKNLDVDADDVTVDLTVENATVTDDSENVVINGKETDDKTTNGGSGGSSGGSSSGGSGGGSGGGGTTTDSKVELAFDFNATSTSDAENKNQSAKIEVSSKATNKEILEALYKAITDVDVDFGYINVPDYVEAGTFTKTELFKDFEGRDDVDFYNDAIDVIGANLDKLDTARSDAKIIADGTDFVNVNYKGVYLKEIVFLEGDSELVKFTVTNEDGAAHALIDELFNAVEKLSVSTSTDYKLVFNAEHDESVTFDLNIANKKVN